MNKKYRYFENETMEEYDYEGAKDWLIWNLHFSLDYTTDTYEIAAQNELIEVLLETYFTREEIEDPEETWEDDSKEREREYKELQGF